MVILLTSYSDYRHQEDENIASRGSIAMKTATLRVAPGGEKLRFEVQSAPPQGHRSSGVQKWYVKANHPVEASRWTQAIRKSIEWYKREGADGEVRGTSGESRSSLVKTRSQRSLRGSISTLPKRRLEPAAAGNESSASGFDNGDDEEMGQDDSPEDGDEEVDDAEQNDDSSAAESTARVPPYDTTFDLHGNSTMAQMELTSQLLSNLALPPSSLPRTQELKAALKDSFVMVQGMVNEYVQMAKERDEWWQLKLKHEQERQAVWEESLQTVVKEGEVLENELRMRSRKRGSRFFDATVTGTRGTLKQRPTLLSIAQSPTSEGAGKNDYFPAMSVPTRVTAAEVVSTPKEQDASSFVVTPIPKQHQQSSLRSTSIRDQADNATLVDTDEEDEFYDAIEANNLPNLDVHAFLASPGHSEHTLPTAIAEPYAGYKNLRDRLPIGSDNRPSTSLWSVLKHSIGKDLTKISFPVFFNEPTSMLQRMVRLHTVFFVLANA
jgi:oxysterol-binding protein 1